MPPLGLLFGWLLLGERVQLFDVFGIVPVALGIYLVTRPPRLKTPQAHAAIAGNACLTVGDAIRCPAGK
jgi:drug/metabolite transporter (DMT)-like permease